MAGTERYIPSLGINDHPIPMYRESQVQCASMNTPAYDCLSIAQNKIRVNCIVPCLPFTASGCSRTPRPDRRSCGHSGHCADGLVDAAEVVDDGPAHDGGPVVLLPFTEAVGQSSKSTKPMRALRFCCSTIEVDTRSGSACSVTKTSYGSYFRRGILDLAFLRLAMNPDEVREHVSLLCNVV